MYFNYIEHIPHHHINELIELCEPHVYHNSTELFYEGHVPHVSYCLMEGEIIFRKGKKESSTITKGAMVGVKELLSNSPAKVTATIRPKSLVCVLDKSTLKEILVNDELKIKEFIADLIKNSNLS